VQHSVTVTDLLFRVYAVAPLARLTIK